MGFLTSLAIKNLFRYARRTIITSIAIAAGIAIYIWADAFMLGVQKESDRNLIWYETGSAAVFDSRYWNERDYMPLKYGIGNYKDVIALLAKNNIQATGRTAFRGEVIYNDKSFQILASGIDPTRDEAVFRIKKDKLISKGVYLTSGNEEVLIGSTLAEDLGATVGDSIALGMRSKFGAYDAPTLKIAGILDSTNPVLDKATVLIPLDIADKYLDMESSVTQIAVSYPEYDDQAKDMKKTEAIVKALNPGFVIKDYNDLSGNPNVLDTKKKFLGILLFLVFVIAAVGIINTTLMAVFERIREIGMMRSLGMADKSIRYLFVIEAGGIGLIGSAVGVLLGVLLTWYTVAVGFDFSYLMKGVDIGYRVGAVFRAAWNPPAIYTAFILGVAASCLCSIIPSSKAIKMEITECLRYQ